jgi:hypothetical protein
MPVIKGLCKDVNHFCTAFFFTLRNALIKLLFAFILKFYVMRVLCNAGNTMEAGDFSTPHHSLHAPSAPFLRSPLFEMTLERGNTGANTSLVIPTKLHVIMETKVSGLYGISES